jgi:hypothetical protein
MQSIEISGIYTYIDNIKKLKIGDNIILRKNPNNQMTKDAIAAYHNNMKIGYIPFNDKMIDINNKYTVGKININQRNPLLTIECKYNPSNFIELFSTINSNNIIKNTKYNDTLNHFIKYLKSKGFIINDIGIVYCDDNFINLLIKTDTTTIFNTVTRKYYEENIFKYDEFYKFNLIPKCVFEPFLIHRLETYIYKKYTSLEKILNKKSLKYNNSNNIKIEKDDFNYEEIDNILTNIFPNITSCKTDKYLCYNHNYKVYYNIDYYDDNNIIIKTENIKNILTPENYIKFLLIKIISCKNDIYIYNQNKLIKVVFNYTDNYDNNYNYIINKLSS